MSEPPGALGALRDIPARRRETDQSEHALIKAARAEGFTWREIAVALGLDSPQAAQQRFERLADRLHDTARLGSPQ